MTATMNEPTQATIAADDFDLIARAFVAEEEVMRDATWTALVEFLTDAPLERSAPERLVAPALDHLWVGAA